MVWWRPYRHRTGNFHAQLLLASDEDMAKAKKLVKGMVKRAIALGGTCTGEHGVGIGKREYLYEELGYGTVELMKRIKRTIDPLNLFNPGKVSCRSSCLVSSLTYVHRCTRLRHRNPALRGVHRIVIDNTLDRRSSWSHSRCLPAARYTKTRRL